MRAPAREQVKCGQLPSALLVAGGASRRSPGLTRPVVRWSLVTETPSASRLDTLCRSAERTLGDRLLDALGLRAGQLKRCLCWSGTARRKTSARSADAERDVARGQVGRGGDNGVTIRRRGAGPAPPTGAGSVFRRRGPVGLRRCVLWRLTAGSPDADDVPRSGGWDSCVARPRVRDLFLCCKARRPR